MKKLGVGIIGTGSIADYSHAPAISATGKTSLVAVLSRSPERGKKFLQKHGAVQGTVHETLESFVNDPRIDLVIICTPDIFHAQQARACLMAKKHVLLEKPMALSVTEAEALITVANVNNVRLAIGLHLRFHKGHKKLYNEVVTRKIIGSVRHMRALWAFPQQDDTNWRTKEAFTKWWSLSAVGAHCFDLARWFAVDNAEWGNFSSIIDKSIWRGQHDETAIIAAQFASGISMEIVSSVQFGPYNRFEIFGSNGYVFCENTMGREGGGSILLNGETFAFDKANPYGEQLKNVVESIENHTPLVVGAEIGLRNVKDLLRAIEQ